MAKTRSRSGVRTFSPVYPRAPRPPRRSRGRLRIRLDPRLLLRALLAPLAVLILIVLAAAALAGSVWLLNEAGRGLLSLLGAGAFLVLLGVGVAGWECFRLGADEFLRRNGRRAVGLLLLFTGGLAAAALARPSGISLVGVGADEVSLGGLLGEALLGEPGWERVARVGVPVLFGVALVYPRSVPITFRALRWVAVGIVRLRLPQRIVVLVMAAVRCTASLCRSLRAGLGARGSHGEMVQDGALLGPVAPVHASRERGTSPRATEHDAAGQAPVQSTMLPILPEGEEDEGPVPSPAWNRWEMPQLGLLEQMAEPEPVDQTQRARQIEEALASYGVEAKVVQIHVGPAVTQFGVEPGWDRKYREVKERDATGKYRTDKDGNPKVRQDEVSRTRVKVERIASLSNNLALALAAPSVRIEAPVPGKHVVGIEVPNISPDIVPLRSVIESPPFQRLRSKSKLALALGKGVAGETVVADLAHMPHLLIAGATGSGKSVCINTVISCILMHATPDEVRFLMVDPKRVELVPYNPIPHLLAPVIVDADKVVGTLQWVLREMEERYRRFASAGVRNIEGYLRSPKMTERLPYWVLVIDELADLMMVAPYEVERSICRLAQLARATGIHLVVATQRPSVDVVTGLIKANFPTRISFAVTSHIDSRTILDTSGAEKLLGRGDMLYMATDAAKPKRVQGTYCSDADVERIVEFWGDERFRLLRPPQFAEEMERLWSSSAGRDEGEADVLMERARELAESADRVSTSFLQRRLRIGYPRAARLMEALKAEGYGEDPDSFEDL